MRKLLLVSLLVVIVILVVVFYVYHKRHQTYMSGMWVGDPSFLEKSQLQDLQLFLAPLTSGEPRQGYLIMTNHNGEFIANYVIELEESISLWPTLRGKYTKSIRVIADQSPLPFPERIYAKISILEGSMVLFDDEKIYAFLWKDLAASYAANESYNHS